MTETAPLAGPLKERAKEGVDRLLLAPVYLLYEIVAVLFPGVLFIVLLLLKGNHSVVAALQSPLLGYKTKMFVALLLGYLAGKVFSSPADGLRIHFSERFVKEAGEPGSTHAPAMMKRFLIGVFFLPGLFASEHALDYLVLALMNVSFSVTTGVVLLVSSLIPGDHNLRWGEAAIGALLMVRGYRGFRGCLELAVSMLGLTLSGMAQKLFPGNLAAGLKVALQLMSVQTAPQTNLQTVEQPVQSPSAPSTTPQSPSPPTSDQSA
ncbi:MAG TPA: hypothetical protein VN830_07290 [Verrucomicrobiae bacterium]|nr:hypothetical protein [Verrucomicrobiae bacterium]